MSRASVDRPNRSMLSLISGTQEGSIFAIGDVFLEVDVGALVVSCVASGISVVVSEASLLSDTKPGLANPVPLIFLRPCRLVFS